MNNSIKLVVLIALIAIPVQLRAQTCSATDITIGSQADIDGFQVSYGPCTSISGSLTIEGADITHLDGLAWLTDVGADLVIQNNTLLANVGGLSALTSVGNNVEVHQNPVLTGCFGLSALLDEIDDDLPGPGPGIAGIPDVGANATVENNAEGCNSIEESILPPPAFNSDSCSQVAGTTDFHWIDEIGNYGFCEGIEYAVYQDLNLQDGTGVLEGYDVSEDCLANSIYTFSISEDGLSIESLDIDGVLMTLTREENQACFVGRWRLDGDSFLAHLSVDAIKSEFSADSCSQVAGTTNIHWQDMNGASDFCEAVEYTVLTDLDLEAGLAALEGYDVSDEDCIVNEVYQLSLSEDGMTISGTDGSGGQMKLYRTEDQQCFVGHWILDDENWLGHFSADALRDASFEDGFEPVVEEEP